MPLKFLFPLASVRIFNHDKNAELNQQKQKVSIKEVQ